MSVRNVVFGIVGGMALLPAGVAAQERQPAPRARVYINQDPPEEIRARIQAVTQRRARLGVTVDMRAGENDSIGATLQSVTPGGPAAKAGLRSGDIVTKIGGKSLVAKDNTKADEDESLPGVRLVEYVAQLKPKDTVAVEYRRGAARQTATLVTGDEPVWVFEGPAAGQFEFNMPDNRVMIERSQVPGGMFGRGEFAFAFGGGLANLELAPLNPDLGAYFGTTEGVLVINVPKESTLGLKGGDVVLNIDGRKAANPGALLRILRTYEPGESVKFEVMRNKARTTVTGMLEQRKRDE